MNAQNRNCASSETGLIAATTAPSFSKDSRSQLWSLKQMSRFISPVEAIWHFGQGQMAPNLISPQFKHKAQVICRPLLRGADAEFNASVNAEEPEWRPHRRSNPPRH